MITKIIFLCFPLLLLSDVSIAQNNEDIIYIKRYDISIDVAGTSFVYNKKIKGVVDWRTRSMINFYRENSEAIKDFLTEITRLGLDSFYLPKLNGYLYKSKEKLGTPNGTYLYFGQFVVKEDTISAFARQPQVDEKVQKDILKIINQVRVGDVKGDIYYFRDFEFTSGVYLRHCQSCTDSSILRMTTNGAKIPSGYHKAVLIIQADTTNQSIDKYIETEREKREMKVVGEIPTASDGNWQIVLTHNLADKNEAVYEYLLKKGDQFFIAEYTCPNIIETRRQEIEMYLSSFRIK